MTHVMPDDATTEHPARATDATTPASAPAATPAATPATTAGNSASNTTVPPATVPRPRPPETPSAGPPEPTPEPTAEPTAEPTPEQTAEQRAEQLIADACHDLRTPLTALRGALALLEGDLGDTNDHLVGIARRSAERLLQLIETRLDPYAGGRPIASGVPTSAVELVETVLTTLQPLADTSGISLSGGARPTARLESTVTTAPADEIVQVLTHLVGNAVANSPVGSTVQVTVRPDRGQVRFEVADTGRGLGAYRLAEIQALLDGEHDGVARPDGSEGRGLAESAEIVARHGGRMWVHSTPGAGSVFGFALPSAVPEPDAPTARRLLVVDDDADLRDVVRFGLEQAGWQASLAASAQEAFAAALVGEARAPFDALLLDLRMPEVDGRAALARWLADPRTCDVPVVFLTAAAEPDGAQLRALGATAVIGKPFDPMTLAGDVARALGWAT